MSKFLKAFSLSLLFVLVFSLNVFAFSTSTYNDVSATSSTAQNLIYKAVNYDSFENSDFIIFQNEQYSYYIVWGDLKYNGSSVTGSNVEYIQYFRSGSGFDYQYYYQYSTDTQFSLSVNNEVVTNIDGLGFVSPQYREFDYQNNSIRLLIFICACAGAVMILTFRGVS